MRIPFCAAVLASLTGCASTSTGPGDLDALRATSRAWLEAARANDWPRLVQLYTESAVLLPPNAAEVKSRAAIETYFAAFPKITEVVTEDLEIEARGDVAYVRGRYTMRLSIEGVSPVVDTGKYLEIRRRQSDGRWLIDRDMFSSNLAPRSAVSWANK